MSKIQLPIIITKDDCHRCHELKDWLDSKALKYVEKDINDEEFVHQLLHDNNFVMNFCAVSTLMVSYPNITISLFLVVSSRYRAVPRGDRLS